MPFVAIRGNSLLVCLANGNVFESTFSTRLCPPEVPISEGVRGFGS